jgi:hypothetical protein
MYSQVLGYVKIRRRIHHTSPIQRHWKLLEKGPPPVRIPAKGHMKRSFQIRAGVRVARAEDPMISNAIPLAAKVANGIKAGQPCWGDAAPCRRR